MTATMTEEEVDLSDLDSLDDDKDHIICGICYPRMKAKTGDLVTVLCGKRLILAFGEPREVADDTKGPHCSKCQEIFDNMSCPVCGGIP